MIDVLSKVPSDFEERASSKAWKDRQSAVNDLLNLFDCNDSFVPANCDDVVSTLRRIVVKDINVYVAGSAARALGLLAKGLEGKPFKNYGPEVGHSLLERFKEKKPSLVAELHTALNYVVLSVSLNDLVAVLTVVLDPAKCRLSHMKQEILTFVCRVLSWEVIQPQWTRQVIAKSGKDLATIALRHADDQAEVVRGLAIGLFALLASHLGERALAPFIEKLGSVKEKKFQELLVKAKEAKEDASKRKTSVESVSVEGAAAGSGASGGSGDVVEQEGGQEDEEIDPYTLLEPQDLLKKIGPGWVDEISALTKWSEKQSMLVRLESAAKELKRFSPDRLYDSILAVLKKLMGDINIYVATHAVECIGLLAEGLRDSLAVHVPGLLLVLLEKFKEKKPTIITALHTSLKSLLLCCSGSLAEPVAVSSDVIKRSKLAPVRREALVFVRDAVVGCKQRTSVQKVEKALVNLAVLAMEDASDTVREVAVAVFCAVAERVGTGDVTRGIGKLQQARRKKVEDALAKVKVAPVVSQDARPARSAHKKESAGGLRQPTMAVPRGVSSPSKASAVPVTGMSVNAVKTAVANNSVRTKETGTVVLNGVEDTLVVLASGRPSKQVVDALKFLCSETERDQASVAKFANDVAPRLAAMLHDLLAGVVPFDERACQHVLQTMNALFSRPLVARSLSLEVQRLVMEELLRRLLDPSLMKLVADSVFLTALNQVTLKILENSSTTASFSVLLGLMRTEIMAPEAESSDSSEPSLVDIVAKCILKLTKPLRLRIDDVSVTVLLEEIHALLSVAPPGSPIWALRDARPLRTVKTLLNELVKVVGPTIRNELPAFPPESPVLKIVEQLVTIHFEK